MLFPLFCLVTETLMLGLHVLRHEDCTLLAALHRFVGPFAWTTTWHLDGLQHQPFPCR